MKDSKVNYRTECGEKPMAKYWVDLYMRINGSTSSSSSNLILESFLTISREAMGKKRPTEVIGIFSWVLGEPT